jgi:hypothetical protein
MNIPDRVCERCGTEYTPTGTKQKYCPPCVKGERAKRSLETAQRRAKRKAETGSPDLELARIACAVCGEPFIPKTHNGIHCSDGCREIAAANRGNKASLAVKNKRGALVEEMGGACSRCGYDEFSSAIALHHVNPDERDGPPVTREEADKCALLCFNCHNALHAGEWRGEFEKSDFGWVFCNWG